MASLTPEIYLAEQAKMDRPVPGMSLTNDPENPAPYEQAPRFTVIHEANEYLWDFVTDEERYPALMEALSAGTPVMQIVQTILFNEFQKGSWNPDLMLMLAEPLAYMLIALGERLDIDMDIDGEGEEEEVFGAKMEESKMEELKSKAAGLGMGGNAFITPEMLAEAKKLPSLLEEATPETEPEVSQQPSLMAPPEGQ